MEKRIMETFKTLSDSLSDLVLSNNDALLAVLQEQDKKVAELLAEQQKVIDSLHERIAALGALQSTLFSSLSVTNPGIHAQLIAEIRKAQDQLIEQGRPDAEFIQLSRYLTDTPPKKPWMLSPVPENTTSH